MAAGRVECVCETCGASFEATRSDIKTCPAHRKRHRMPVEKCVPPGSSATSWVPRAKMKLADRVDQWLFAHDAANECVHGALPHDRVIPKQCECWGKRQDFQKAKPKAKPVKRTKKKAAA